MTRDTSAVGALDALAWRGWVVLHDVARPGRRRATIDHVLVGPGGVFVTSRKKWPGPVAIVDGELHLAGRASPREITEVAEAAADVLALVPEVPVHPVLCLERHQPITGWVRNVMLCASSNVEELLTMRPAVLGPEQVQQVAAVLTARLPRVLPPDPAEPVTSARAVLSRPLRALVQAGTMAAAALLVIGVLQTRVVDQISSAVDGFVTEVATVGDKSKRKPAQVQPRERTSPRQGDRDRDRTGDGSRRGAGDGGRGDRRDRGDGGDRAGKGSKEQADQGSDQRADQGRDRRQRDRVKKRGKRHADDARATRPGRKASGRDGRPDSSRKHGRS